MTATIHPAHAANMTRMALRLAEFLAAHVTPNPAVVALLDDEDWGRIADLAGERRTPSPATQACTVTLLRAINAREAIR
jgi:hypothetical protein